MKRILLVVALSAAADGGIAGPAAQSLQWTVMEAYGMKFDYPTNIFSVDDGPAVNGDGRKLRSADSSAGLMFYVESNRERDTPAAFVNSRLKVPSAELDYKRITNRFAVVSGARGGRIYYSRCNFPEGPSGPRHCIYVNYNESEKRAWDSIVTRISLSLR
jgi:hypothetical protein